MGNVCTAIDQEAVLERCPHHPPPASKKPIASDFKQGSTSSNIQTVSFAAKLGKPP